MSKSKYSMDYAKISAKEFVRKNIRDAINVGRSGASRNVYTVASSLSKSDNIMQDFIVNFRKTGGKYIPCTREDFLTKLKQVLAGIGATTVLNTAKNLIEPLKTQGIDCLIQKPYGDNPCVAIVYSDALIAMSGSIVVSTEYTTYTSVRNLSKDLIVISFEEKIVNSISEALALQSSHDKKSTHCFSEIITPSISRDENGVIFHDCKNPRIILLLISNFQSHA